MNNFDLKKYLREGKLYEGESLETIDSMDVTYTDEGKFWRVDVRYKDGRGDRFKNIESVDVDLPRIYDDVELEQLKKELSTKGIELTYNDSFSL
jgi:hypothetical protein